MWEGTWKNHCNLLSYIRLPVQDSKPGDLEAGVLATTQRN